MHVGEVAVEIKTEDDSNNMTDSLRDDQPSAGMFAFIILHSVSKNILSKISTSAAVCCYTTLWNEKISKCYWVTMWNVTINIFN